MRQHCQGKPRHGGTLRQQPFGNPLCWHQLWRVRPFQADLLHPCVRRAIRVKKRDICQVCVRCAIRVSCAESKVQQGRENGAPNGPRGHVDACTGNITSSLPGSVSTYCLGWTRPIRRASSTTQCRTAATGGSMLPFRSQDGAGPAIARSPGVCISTPRLGTPCRGMWRSMPRSSRGFPGSAVWESIPFEP